MNIFKVLESTVVKLIKDKVKLGSLTKENIDEVLRNQLKVLGDLDTALSGMSPEVMQSFKHKYQSHQFNKSNKLDAGAIHPHFHKLLTGNASAIENKYHFASILVACKTLKHILQDVQKNLPKIMSGGNIAVLNCKISDVMLLGIIRECDMFVKFTSILWDHFMKTITMNDSTLLGYKIDYLNKNVENYAKCVSNAVNKEKNYSFLKEVELLRAKNNDMVLYANNQSFLNFFTPSSVSASAARYVEQGIIGFNLFSLIVSFWDDWKHSQYLKNKDFKEWLELSSTLLRMAAMDVDPNSPEYQRLVKLIKAYEQKIVDIDRKIDEYEKER